MQCGANSVTKRDTIQSQPQDSVSQKETNYQFIADNEKQLICFQSASLYDQNKTKGDD